MISFSFSITVSISAVVLYLLNENRTGTKFGLLLIALITCEPTSAPLLQALPPDAQILFISRLNKIISDFSDFGNEAFNTVYKLSLIHISEPTRQAESSYAVFCLK